MRCITGRFKCSLVQYEKDDETRKERPKVISHSSRSLTQTAKRYSQIEKETLAIHVGCMKFELFVLGHTFTVVTDHKPLVSLFNSPTKFRVERITLKLQGFDFNVVHKPGKWNPSDFLSGHPLPARHLSAEELEESQELECHLLKALQIPSALSLYEIQEESSVDPIVSKIISGLKTDTLKVNDPAIKDYAKVVDQLSIAHGILLKGERMVIPPSLVKKVVHIGHEGHQGIVKTKQLLRSLVWFPNMDKLIEKHIAKWHLLSGIREHTYTRTYAKVLYFQIIHGNESM